VTDPRGAYSLSVTHRESARTVHGESSEDAGRQMPVVPSRVRLAAAARMPDGPSESDEVLAKHRSTFDRYNIVSPTEKLEAARKLAAFSEDAARRAAGAPAPVTPLFAKERAK